MIIAICCTRNWYKYMPFQLFALFKYNHVDKIYMFIEDDNIPYIQHKEIKFINVNKLPDYITKESPNYSTKYTKLSYLRCYFSKVLKEDKVFYIDADAIVVDDISELWEMNIKDYALAGIHEPGEWSKHLSIEGMDDKYINSGVLLMNLKKIRQEQLDDEMIQLLNKNKYAFPDQDVINIVCKDKIKYLSNIYNSTETTGFRDDAKIIHYIRERKGWLKESPRSEVWYNYHNEYLKGGGKMDNYFVRATRNFDDNEHNGTKRIKGQSEWWCSAERYEFLKANNAVELIEIKKVEENIVPLQPEKLEEVANEIIEALPTTEEIDKAYEEINKPKSKKKKSKK